MGLDDRTAAAITGELKDRLRRHAEKVRRSMSQVIRIAVEEYLDRVEAEEEEVIQQEEAEKAAAAKPETAAESIKCLFG